MLPRNEIIAEARRWIGVPFRHQGRTRHGVDCVGLVIVVGRAVGSIPAAFEVTGYPRRPDGLSLRQQLLHYAGDSLAWIDALPGDILLMKWDKAPMHVGIVSDLAGVRTLIHSYAHDRRVIEQRLPIADLPKLAVRAFRYPGVEAEWRN